MTGEPQSPPAADERRRAANLLIQPDLQLRLPLYLIGLTAVFESLLILAISTAYRGFYRTVAAEQPAYMRTMLDAQTQDLLIVAVMLATGYVLSVLLISVVQLHRLVGPTVALRRHVEALKNGDYSARVRLRKKDAFGELADDLNELARLLEERGKPADAAR